MSTGLKLTTLMIYKSEKQVMKTLDEAYPQLGIDFRAKYNPSVNPTELECVDEKNNITATYLLYKITPSVMNVNTEANGLINEEELKSAKEIAGLDFEYVLFLNGSYGGVLVNTVVSKMIEGLATSVTKNYDEPVRAITKPDKATLH